MGIEDKKDLAGSTILVVEDDDANFVILNEILKDAGAVVIRAENGHEALKLFKTSPNLFAILMDVQIPLLNGLEVTKSIRKVNAQIPIIAQTVFNQPEDQTNALEAGCNLYITKPLNPEKLLKLLYGFL